MTIVRDPRETWEAVSILRASGATIGFVPTMGALHRGHLSLVEASLAECEHTVVSVFVNPTQFGPTEDLDKYPRDLERDAAMVRAVGDVRVFAPSVAAMYPDGFATTVRVGQEAAVLEGAARPGHFDGVATVVLKLLQIVPATHAYFGRKDYQQSLVVERMVRDLNVPTLVRVCPIVREADGLAMSSRNAYLSRENRERAAVLWRALQLAEALHTEGEADAETLRAAMAALIDAEGGVETEYIALLADGTVEPVERVEGPTVVAVAARVGTTRLIDNHTIG
ncbi:MAG: pantoate--beta-alanine ligase [Planctomycetota bacterium]